MDNLTKELIAIVLQHLNESKYHETAHTLEQESGIFFNAKYLEEKVIAGEWEELEKYLLGFTKIDDNKFSLKLFFEIRKQKYLEAIDRNEPDRVLEILEKDLSVFSSYDDDTLQEMCCLLFMNDFREHARLRDYVDAQTSRMNLVIALMKLVEANPNFRQKLAFPSFSSGRLSSMLNESLNMQHSLCENWRPCPEMETLLTDHECKPLSVTTSSTFAPVPFPTLAHHPSLGVDGSFYQSGASTSANLLADLPGNSAASLLEPSVATASCLPNLSSRVSSLKRPLPPPATPRTVDYPIVDLLLKRLRSAPSSDEGPSSSVRAMASTIGKHVTSSLGDLPRNVACSLYQGSAVTSMDFHPTRHTLLLVGSANGEVALWELRTKKKVVSKPFAIREMESHSSTFQAIVARDRHMSVIRALWSPDGGFIGVAFNKHLIHLYGYAGSNDLQQLLEVEAHNGQVNDLAFVHPPNQLCIATCGDDKLVKVWDFNGQKLYSFEGHQTPIYSICPNQLEEIQFIMSISIDGKIKAWVYDDPRSRAELEAPGLWCTTLLYSDDRSRLFSCGTSREGNPSLVELIESNGKVKRIYRGLTKKPAGTVVHFDTTQNQFLAVGEDSQIKFWDMNSVDVLTSTNAEGGLSSRPCLRFNKEGSLLAVSTIGNGFKILATAASLRSLRAVETSPAVFRSPTAYKAAFYSDAAIMNTRTPAAATVSAWNSILARNSYARVSSAPVLGSSIAAAINVDDSNEENRPSFQQTVTHCEDEPKQINNEEPMILDGAQDRIRPWQLAEITHPVQCQQLTVPQGNNAAKKVLRFLYTHSGAGLFALGSNGILTVWKWQSDEQNPGAKATTRALPQQWKLESPDTKKVMTNEPARGGNPDDHVPCLALSHNDHYAISAYGADASLFNKRTFGVIITFNTPPATTCVVFYPLNNNILDDLSISIYEVKEDDKIAILEGHTKGITGLAFSTNLNEWSPRAVLWAPITCATYLGDGHLVYASLRDGSVWVLEANTLRPRCHVALSAYYAVPEVNDQNGGEAVYALTIAAHPQERNQLTDGSVKVMESLASEGEWGESPPYDEQCEDDPKPINNEEPMILDGVQVRATGQNYTSSSVPARARGNFGAHFHCIIPMLLIGLPDDSLGGVPRIIEFPIEAEKAEAEAEACQIFAKAALSAFKCKTVCISSDEKQVEVASHGVASGNEMPCPIVATKLLGSELQLEAPLHHRLKHAHQDPSTKCSIHQMTNQREKGSRNGVPPDDDA